MRSSVCTRRDQCFLVGSASSKTAASFGPTFPARYKSSNNSLAWFFSYNTLSSTISQKTGLPSLSWSADLRQKSGPGSTSPRNFSLWFSRSALRSNSETGARTRQKTLEPSWASVSSSWSPAFVRRSTTCSLTNPCRAVRGTVSPPSALDTVSVRKRATHSRRSHSMPAVFRSSSPGMAWNQSVSISHQLMRAPAASLSCSSGRGKTKRKSYLSHVGSNCTPSLSVG
mmetsp:Transcript_16136/g.42532  ORF Transcript_16136/g.42532 Transcript_16136/m.42532 type:complete len:227 (-) Transcript_16136:200-880(-)